MGRGRAKAKQTKVARELKYYSPSTDLSALERELHSATASGGYARTNHDVDDDEGDDEYDEYAEESAALDEDDDTAEDSDPNSVYDDYGKWASGPR